MRILQLYNRVPHPLHDGGALAVHAMSLGLHEAGADVQLFCLNASRSRVAEAAIPAFWKSQFNMQLHAVDTRLYPWSAAWNLLEGSAYHVSRFYHPAVASALAVLLQRQNFDIIQLEATFMGVYLPIIRQHSQAKVVLRAHNIDYRIWQRLAAGCQQPLKKWYLQLQASRLQRFEEALYAAVDAVVAISEVDAAYIRQLTKAAITNAPMGLAADRAASAPNWKPENLHRCSFVASLDWQPNQEAVRWLHAELWPAIRQQAPNSLCVVAGKNAPASFAKLTGNGLDMLGFVPDAAQTMRDNPLFLVPIRSGSGIRIKILEALALGLPVVSTTLGAEGLSVTHRAQLWLADTPAAFAEAVTYLQAHPHEAYQMGERGKAWVQKHFNREEIGRSLLHFYRNLPA